MSLTPLDFAVIAAYLVLALGAGIWASRRAGGSGEQYFLAGRSLPGWLVGISIVATTFAADTPLAISGMVASKGIAANWFWWASGIAHVGVFLFWSRLWRRAEVVTDAEFVELRYGPGPGAQLRTAKAVFFAVLYNGIVLGWVLRAMQKIAQPFVHWEQWLPAGLWSAWEAVAPVTSLGGAGDLLTVVALVALAAGYSTLGGLRGVVLTDLLQFTLAIAGSFALAGYALAHVGGLAGLPPRLAAELGPERATEVLTLVPTGGLVWMPVSAFGVYLLIRWWAHPLGDGGGYIAQRLSAARDPAAARQAAGVFVLLHYVVRPWPWILVGLAGLLAFPPGDEARVFAEGALVATDRETAYPLLAGLLLPPGVLGLLLASLAAAFMSTVDTHLNWGVSYLAHDIWRGRIRPDCGPREEVLVARVGSVLFALLAVLAATRIDSVEAAWKFVAAMGSGLGLPVLLRWVWWRVNAQAEIAGALASLSVATALAFWAPPDMPWEWGLGLAVAAGAAAALGAIFLFDPPRPEVLDRFYARVRPPGFWGPVAERAGAGEGAAVGQLAGAWALGALALMAAILAPGWLLLGSPLKGAVAVFVAAGAAGACRVALRRIDEVS